ncbi:hypothetical protein IFR05_016892, partial [Cadophora sp. M221]
MEEARRLKAQNFTPTNTYTRPRAQKNLTVTSSFQAPALAQGNIARPYIQQPVSQPIHYLGPAAVVSNDDHLKQPYISSVVWRKLKRNLSNLIIVKLFSKAERDRLKTAALHVPFSQEELKLLYQTLVEESRTKRPIDSNPAVQIVQIMKDNAVLIPKILKALQHPKKDASKATINIAVKIPIAFPRDKTPDHLMALLRDREVYGISPMSSRQGRSSFKAVVNRHLKDALIRQSPDSFIGGALAHSDTHNMQYNKPGNLL